MGPLSDKLLGSFDPTTSRIIFLLIIASTAIARASTRDVSCLKLELLPSLIFKNVVTVSIFAGRTTTLLVYYSIDSLLSSPTQ
jgi:hypothetical protein